MYKVELRICLNSVGQCYFESFEARLFRYFQVFTLEISSAIQRFDNHRLRAGTSHLVNESGCEAVGNAHPTMRLELEVVPLV
jgi:hypothetical protein